MDLDTLQELIRIFEASGLSEIEIEESGQRMRLQKPQAGPAMQPTVTYAPVPTEGAAPVVVSAGDVGVGEKSDGAETHVATIDSPMVGTFYVSPAPGEPTFVKEGDQVEAGQTVCIVEAMKLMNEVGAKVRGVIDKVLVKDGQPVEFGQALFAITPSE